MKSDRPCSWFSNNDDEEDASSDSDSALSTESLYTLAGIYLGCSLAAALVLAVFLDPLDRLVFLSNINV